MDYPINRKLARLDFWQSDLKQKVQIFSDRKNYDHNLKY